MDGTGRSREEGREEGLGSPPPAGPPCRDLDVLCAPPAQETALFLIRTQVTSKGKEPPPKDENVPPQTQESVYYAKQGKKKTLPQPPVQSGAGKGTSLCCRHAEGCQLGTAYVHYVHGTHFMWQKYFLVCNHLI